MKKTQKGFTLVELLVVIAILAILSTVAVVGYTSFIDKAEKQAAKTEVAQIESVLESAFILDDEVTLTVTVTEDGKSVEKVITLKYDTNGDLTAEPAGTGVTDNGDNSITKDLGEVVAKLYWDGSKLVYKYESTSDKAPFLVELAK